MNETFLQGRTAVVTGATRGIGFAIASALADAGATVAICGRSQESVDEAVRRLTNEKQRKVAGKAADVRASTNVAALFEWIDGEMGGPDILVNNAGVGIMKSTAELTAEDWRQTIETNLSGGFYCSREALLRMKKRGGGYNASKFGLSGFTEAMMLDHRHDNVRVSHIMPGSVDTEFSGRGSSGGSAKADWKIAPEDIGEIVLMLLRMPERT